MFKGLSLIAATEIRGIVSRYLRSVPYFVIGAIIGLFGLGYLLAAGHDWLLTHMSPMSANLLIGGVLLLLCIVLIVIGNSIKAPPPRSTSTTLRSSALMAAPFAVKVIGNRVTLGTVAVAAVVGIGALLGRYVGRQS